MSRSERIKSRRIELGLSQADVAKAVGISQPAYSKVEKGGDTAYWVKLARALQTTPEYLQYGEVPGSRVITEYSALDSTPHPDKYPPAPYSFANSTTAPRPVRAWTNEDELESGDILVPALELRLSAGPGEVCWQVDLKGRGRVFQSDYLDRLGVKQECAATMTVSGTSMEPRLWDGDSVLVDYCRQTVLDGNVYALVWQEEYYIKRLFKEPGGAIRLVSDNPDKSRHPDRLITTEHMEELQIIGRVVGIVGGRL